MRAMLRHAAGILIVAVAAGCSGGGSGGKTGAAGASPSGGAGSSAAGSTGAAGTVVSTGGAGGQAGTLPASGAAGVGAAGSGGPDGGGGASAGASGNAGSSGGDAAAGATGGPCGAGTLLCEDFESYNAPADLSAAWTTTVTAATLAVDTTKAAHGTKALHIKAAAGTPVAVIAKQGAPLFPIAGNMMYGRVMMWLTGTPGGDYHWNNIQAAGTMPGATTWGKYGWGGQFGKILAGYTVRTAQTATTATMDCSNPSMSAFPSGKWVCVEWQFDGTKNAMHLWFDGTLLSDVDVNGMGTRCVANTDLGKPWSAPDFSFLSLGWQQYQGSNGALEMWMDDVAVGTQRIGCPAP
jgi:hypothetical protein